MVTITQLWLPILLSAVGVFFTSSIIHMVLKYHQSDYQQMPNEDGVLEAMGAEKPAPGFYTMPYCTDPKALAEEGMKARFERGPVAFVTVMPNGVPAMGKALGQWFAMCVVMSILVAYLTTRTVAPEAEYLAVFRVAGTAAFLGYAGSIATESIWKGQPWSTSLKHIFDGLLFSLVTAGFFAALWPS